MTTVSFCGVSKAYGTSQVLAPFDLEFPGGVLAVVGPNGSGKSTLLRRTVDLVPGGGIVRFDGVPFRKMSNPRRFVGVSLGPDVLSPVETPKRLLAATALAVGCPRSRVGHVLEECGVAAFQRTRVRKLSRGMQQRVALALALIGDPPTLVLDEPESGLDDASCRWFGDLVEDRRKRGHTIILGTHRPRALNVRPQHAIRLDAGRVVFSAAPADTARLLVECASSRDLQRLVRALPASCLPEGAITGQSTEILATVSAAEVFSTAQRVGAVLTQLKPLAWFDE